MWNGNHYNIQETFAQKPFIQVQDAVCNLSMIQTDLVLKKFENKFLKKKYNKKTMQKRKICTKKKV